MLLPHMNSVTVSMREKFGTGYTALHYACELASKGAKYACTELVIDNHSEEARVKLVKVTTVVKHSYLPGNFYSNLEL